MTPLLEARRLRKVYGGGLGRRRHVAVSDLSFRLPADPASIIAVVGESGSGKTTLAHLLLGLIHPSGGAVLYRGKALHRLSRRERRAFRRDVQAIFQDPFAAFNPYYKVDHALTVPVRKFRLARSESEQRALIEGALEAVGLRPEETLGRYPHQLSGGQRQRVMVARAMLVRPRLIVADEPVSMIDASLRATVLANLDHLHRAFGISLVYITHDVATAYQISERIMVLYRGSVAEVGGVEQVVKSPRHPYTELLIDSIPSPDPDRPWGRVSLRPEAAPAAAAGTAQYGCPFAGRCPRAMPVCHEKAPPLFRTDPGRAVACHLYEGAPIVEADGIDDARTPERRETA
ncbi:MAG TPA: ABC transporter ATP-binding protein [Limnochordia bacterium]